MRLVRLIIPWMRKSRPTESAQEEDSADIVLTSIAAHSSEHTQPSASGTQPSMSGTQPSASDTQPSASGTQSSDSGIQSSASGTQPSASSLRSAIRKCPRSPRRVRIQSPLSPIMSEGDVSPQLPSTIFENLDPLERPSTPEGLLILEGLSTLEGPSKFVGPSTFEGPSSFERPSTELSQQQSLQTQAIQEGISVHDFAIPNDSGSNSVTSAVINPSSSGHQPTAELKRRTSNAARAVTNPPSSIQRQNSERNSMK